MFQISSLRVALLAAIALPAMAAGGGNGNASKVHHALTVDTVDGKVLVHVALENHSDHTIYVPREIAKEKELTGPRFEVRDAAGGEPLAYTGRMVKRGPVTADDFLAIAPHKKHLNTIDITRTYAFKKGRHSYELRYAGPWLADAAKLEQESFSPPPPVRFSYTGR